VHIYCSRDFGGERWFQIIPISVFLTKSVYIGVRMGLAIRHPRRNTIVQIQPASVNTLFSLSVRNTSLDLGSGSEVCFIEYSRLDSAR
jgi:hypothetical protein